MIIGDKTFDFEQSIDSNTRSTADEVFETNRNSPPLLDGDDQIKRFTDDRVISVSDEAQSNISSNNQQFVDQTIKMNNTSKINFCIQKIVLNKYLL